MAGCSLEWDVGGDGNWKFKDGSHITWLPGQLGMPLANGDNVRDRVGCGWRATRLALDIFHMKCNSCDGVDHQKYEPGACRENPGCGWSLVIIHIPVVLMALVCMRFL